MNENGGFHAEEVCGGRSECERKGHFPAWILGYYFRKLHAVVANRTNVAELYNEVFLNDNELKELW